MKSKKKVLGLLVCAVLLVVGSVMGTMAWLTSTTGVAENTFSVGNVKITLDEKDVDDSKTNVTTEGRDMKNTYHLIPGKTYEKDPTVNIDANSEDCWVFVKVNNGLADAEKAGNTTIAAQMTAKGWTAIYEGSNIFYHEDIAVAGEKVAVFSTFTIDNEANVAAFKDASITIIACAVQAEELETIDEAIAALPAEFTN